MDIKWTPKYLVLKECGWEKRKNSKKGTKYEG